MKTSDPRYDKADVQAAAAGHWASILSSCAGIEPASLDGNHHSGFLRRNGSAKFRQQRPRMKRTR